MKANLKLFSFKMPNGDRYSTLAYGAIEAWDFIAQREGINKDHMSYAGTISYGDIILDLAD